MVHIINKLNRSKAICHQPFLRELLEGAMYIYSYSPVIKTDPSKFDYQKECALPAVS